MIGQLDKVYDYIKGRTSCSDDLAAALSYFTHGMSNNINVDGMNTNMQLLVIGPSSVSHKSTAIKEALAQVFPTASKISPLGTLPAIEKFFRYCPDRPVIFHEDEFGRFLKQVKKGGQVVDLLNSLHDGGEYTFPIKSDRERLTVSKKVGLVASTTLSAFKKNCNKEMMEGGFMKRMLVIHAKKCEYMPRSARIEKDKWSCIFTMPEQEIKVHLSRDFLDEHERHMSEMYSSEDDSLAGMWQRAEENIYKLSAIHAVVNREDDVVKRVDLENVLPLVESSVRFQMLLRGIIK